LAGLPARSVRSVALMAWGMPREIRGRPMPGRRPFALYLDPGVVALVEDRGRPPAVDLAVP